MKTMRITTNISAVRFFELLGIFFLGTSFIYYLTAVSILPLNLCELHYDLFICLSFIVGFGLIFASQSIPMHIIDFVLGTPNMPGHLLGNGYGRIGIVNRFLARKCDLKTAEVLKKKIADLLSINVDSIQAYDMILSYVMVRYSMFFQNRIQWIRVESRLCGGGAIIFIIIFFLELLSPFQLNIAIIKLLDTPINNNSYHRILSFYGSTPSTNDIAILSLSLGIGLCLCQWYLRYRVATYVLSVCALQPVDYEIELSKTIPERVNEQAKIES